MPISGKDIASSDDHAGRPGSFARTRSVLARRQLLLIGVGMVTLLLLTAVFAPQIASRSPYEIGVAPPLAPPSSEFLMGSDKLGRDLFARIVFGARSTLLLSLPPVGLAVLVGMAFGLMAGYAGGRLDETIMRLMDIFMAFPALLMALSIVSVLGPSIPNLILTISILYTPAMVRIVRGPVLVVKEKEYIDAARVVGARDHRIVVRHILPNVVSPIIVQATLLVANAIILAAALAYLGFGAPPPAPNWGSMLTTGRLYLTTAPWLSLFPGLAIVWSTAAFILLGNGLRDWIDPRRR